jgi:hypothetical protein
MVSARIRAAGRGKDPCGTLASQSSNNDTGHEAGDEGKD